MLARCAPNERSVACIHGHAVTADAIRPIDPPTHTTALVAPIHVTLAARYPRWICWRSGLISVSGLSEAAKSLTCSPTTVISLRAAVISLRVSTCRRSLSAWTRKHSTLCAKAVSSAIRPRLLRNGQMPRGICSVGAS